MVNYSRSQIPKLDKKKKHYTACDVNRYYCSRQFRHVTDQPVKQVLHAVDDNILQNIPNVWEYFRMSEDIYGPSVKILQSETVRHKVQHVDPIIVSNFPKGIIDIYNNVTLFYEHMHINGIILLNTISWHILFAI